jgi:hypothetical protein
MQSERLRNVARVVGPWLDPKSRRPLILLVVVSFGILLTPLALDVASALFFKLPRGFLWGLGQAVLIGILGCGVWRLGTVHATDAWPNLAPPSDSGRRSRAEIALPWALRLAIGSLLFLILTNPDGIGFADWDFALEKFEAVRRSILDWGEFPWWDPWCRGGFPLAAEPQVGAVSIATPLVLGFGTPIGLRLSAILCIGIAVEGAYRLSFLWFREPWGAAASALIYGLNGGVSVDTAWGYFIAMSYCSLPWLVYHSFRIGQRLADGLWLGFWTAFMVMNGIQYLSLYASVLASAAWLRALRVQPPGRRVELLMHTMAAIGAFLVLSGWRFLTVVLVILDDKRGQGSFWDESPLALFHVLLTRPRPDWPTVIPTQHLATYIETTCYVGPIVVLLALGSLVRGWRWWHTLTILCTWLALGSVQWYQPSSWLRDWPLFASTHVVTRWRFVTALGLGMAAGSVLARWRHSGSRTARILAVVLCVGIATDLIALASQQLPLAFSLKPESLMFPGPTVPDIVNVRQGLGFPCLLRGYGIIEGYEPMLSGYRRDAPSLRRARDDPGYRGEAWTASGTVQPTFWSPNRIEFHVAPGEAVEVNQNPGSWWWVNGKQAFPGTRCAEALRPFIATADDGGQVVLEIRPRGLSLGLILHLVGAVLVVTSGMACRYRARLTEDRAAPAEDRLFGRS